MAPILASVRRPISTSCWRSADVMGLLGILVGLGLLIWLAFRGGVFCCLLRSPHWLRRLLAESHCLPIGRRSSWAAQPVSRSVLSHLSARRRIREADGRQRRGRCGRELHHPPPWRAPGHPRRCALGGTGHLWRRQPFRRIFCDRSDGPVAVSRGEDSAPPRARDGHSWNVHFHHVSLAGHTIDSECDTHAASLAPRPSLRRASA